MAKAKRQRRTSIRTMQADRAIEALEMLERAEAPRDRDEPAPEATGTTASQPEPERKP